MRSRRFFSALRFSTQIFAVAASVIPITPESKLEVRFLSGVRAQGA